MLLAWIWLEAFWLKLESLRFGSMWCVARRRAPIARPPPPSSAACAAPFVVATEDGHAELRQLEALDETLQLLLTLVPAQDLELNLTGVRWVAARWLLDVTLRWRGAEPESETEVIHHVVGLSLRIAAVGQP